MRLYWYGRLFFLISVIVFLCPNVSYATYPPTFSDCFSGDGEDYDQVDACRQLLRSNSRNHDLHVALGKTLDKRQKFKEAIKAYDKALIAFPNEDYFLKRRSISLSNLKEQQWLHNKKQGKASGVNKTPASGVTTQFKLNKIRCTRLAGKTALDACQQAIKENNKDAELFSSIGDIYASQQKNSQAINAYKKAVSLNPGDNNTSEKLKKLLRRQTVVKRAKIPVKSPLPAKKSIKKIAPKNKQVAAKAKSEKKQKLKPTPALKPTPTLKPEQQNFLEQLTLLRSLKEQKIISSEDYEHRKKALLDSTFKVKTVTNVLPDVKKTKKIEPIKKDQKSYKNLNFGNYYALIIGNNQYKYLPELKTAENDAQSLADLLERHYGFKVKLLLNANRYDTLKAMGEFRNTLTKKDNLLIYYAGHGVLDNASERGYWLPVDAEPDFTSNWISTAEVTDTLKALQSWHVLVVADSCYSGTLARSIAIKFTNPEKKYSLIERLLKKKSRTVITSGGLEPVTDSGGDNHSVFAQALLEVLNNTSDVIEAEEVFSRLRDNVILNADQTPEYSNVRKVGHNGGDFIFLRQ